MRLSLTLNHWQLRRLPFNNPLLFLYRMHATFGTVQTEWPVCFERGHSPTKELLANRILGQRPGGLDDKPIFQLPQYLPQ